MNHMFQKRVVESRFMDPTDGFKEKTIPIEIRTDLLTKRVSRVLTSRMKFPDACQDMEMIERSVQNCPFCQPNVEIMTPKFPASIVAEGRIRHGKSIVFPNAFPYSRYGSVTVISDEHYVPLKRFSEAPGILADALKASCLYIEAVQRSVIGVSHASINWNYMPGAGGGLIHPHLQTIVTTQPSNFHRTLLEESSRFFSIHGKNYWTELIQYEKEVNHRYLFNSGDIEFLSSFSPGGMFGEVLAVFNGIARFDQIDDYVLECFAGGMSRIIEAFDRHHLTSLNMTLMLSLCGDDHFWTQARITPRVVLPPWGTSDVNFFEKGHDEIIVILSPEQLATHIGGS